MVIKLNDKTKASLQTWIDKLWLSKTKEKLETAWVLSWLQDQAKFQAQDTTWVKKAEPISSPVAKTWPTWEDLSWLEKAKGYESSQIWLEWINLMKKPPVIWWAVDTTWADKISAPEDTTLPSTDWVWKIWVEWAPWATPSNVDLNKDGVINENELTWDYKKFYDTLSDTEKKLFIATWENAMKKNLDIAEVYANYMRDYNTVKGRKEADEAYRLKQQEISWEIYDTQAAQTLRRATDWVKKLRQSIAYLWDMWMPWKSSQRIESIDNQVKEATTSLNELRKLQSLTRISRELWDEKNARVYEQEMEDLTTKLNDNIDKSIQNAFNTLIEADNNGKLDTVEELTAFRDKMYQDLDMSITGFSDASIAQMQFLVWEVDKAREEAVAYEKNANTINKDMSLINWYYTNANGNPIYSAKWTPIKFTPPVEWADSFMQWGKFYSPKTDEFGNMLRDENWQPIYWSTQVMDEVIFWQKAMNVFAKQYANWQVNIQGLQEAWLWQEEINSIIEMSADITPTKEEMTAYQQAQLDLAKRKQRLEEKKALGITDFDVTSDVWTQNIVDYSTIKRGKENLQCWELVNDYWTKITWSKAWMWDTLDSKLNAVEKIWASDIPVLWGLMVSNPLWNTVWHTWIVQAINADWSIDVLEANAEWKAEWQIPVTRTYPAENIWDMVFSKAPEEKEVTLTDTDIAKFNNATFKPEKLETEEDFNKYKMYLEKLDTIFQDPDADFYDVIDLSKWSGKWSVWERESMSKYGQALWGLKTLTWLVNSSETWPVAWRIMKLDPYSTSVAEFKAVIAWLVPTVARWIFNEVWVLTDTDVQNYMKTLPTLTKTKDQNKLVVYALLRTLNTWMKEKLDWMARSDVDVSKFSWSMKKMEKAISWLESDIWIEQTMEWPEEIAIKEDTLWTTWAWLWASIWFWATPITAESTDEEILNYIWWPTTINEKSSDEDILNFLNQ